MSLTPEQLTVLKQDIAAHPVWASLPQTSDTALFIAEAYATLATPDYWVYRTSLTEKAIYESVTVEGTTWNWTTYQAQSVQERDAWTRMMNPGTINPSLAQTRDGYNRIFAGSGAVVVAQRTHLLAVSRQRATRSQQLFATNGTGTPADPAVMGYEPALTGSDVEQAWAIA